MRKQILKLLFFTALLSLLNVNLKGGDIVRKNNEVRITNSDYPETDPVIVVDPTNANNLISSSIQHKLNFGKDNYINSISYSFDKGLTWKRYLSEVFPEEQYRLVLDATENNLLYDSYGKGHLAWLTTLIKTGWGGVDSIIQTITYRYTTDKGRNWNSLKHNLKRVKSNYDVTDDYNGLKNILSSLKLFEYNYNTYVSYSALSTFSNLLNIELFDVRYPDKKIIITPPDSINYMPAYDIKIKDNRVYITYLSAKFFGRSFQQYLGYFEFDLVSKKIENHKIINNVNFMGSTLLRGVITFNIPGLPTDKLNPNPLLNFVGDSVLISWTGSNYSGGGFFPKNNIFICKGKDGEFAEVKRVFEDNNNHQVNYDIRVNDNGKVLLHYYKLEGPFDNLNYNIEPNFMLSFDGINFSQPYRYVSKGFELTHTQNRNFNYGVGYKTNIDIDSSNLYFTWTDGRMNNGDTEIYSAVYPIFNDYRELFEETSIEIDVENLYPNPFNNKICIDITNYIIQKIDISLYDFNGKKLEVLYDGHINLGVNHFEFIIKNYAEGNYFLHFITENDIIYKKLIKVN